MDVRLTSRLKNTGTILEKLRRSGGGSLPNIQDIAGIRIVVDATLDEQTALAERGAALFTGERREPKIVDRRDDPSHGYRAVHVIVHAHDLPVEVQVRTRLQHQWANTFEKLADIVGRGIRYGEPPDPWISSLAAALEVTLASNPYLRSAAPNPTVQQVELTRQVIDLTGVLSEMIARSENDPDVEAPDTQRIRTLIEETYERMELIIRSFTRLRTIYLGAAVDDGDHDVRPGTVIP